MFQMNSRISAVTVLVAALLCAGGCTHEPTNSTGATYPAGPLHPDTVLVEELPGFSEVAVSDDLSVIEVTFLGPADSSLIQPGDIVAGVLDGGYLRRVVSVETEASVMTIEASHATLEEAVTDVRIDESFSWGERRMIEFSGRTLHEEEVEGGTNLVHVERGLLHIDPTLAFDVDFGFLSLKSATATLDVAVGQDMEVRYAAAGPLDAQGVVDLETIEFPLEARAGLLRFTGTLETTIRLAYKHTATAPMATTQTIDANGNIVSGGTYTTQGEVWDPIWNPEYSGQVSSDTYEGSDWQGRVWIQLESVIHLDRIEGSSGRFEHSLNGWAEESCEALSWGASGGVTGESVMKLGFFSDGPRTETMPALDIEADSVEHSRSHEVVPPGCDEDDPDPDPDPEPGTTPLTPTGGCAPVSLVSCGDVISGDTTEGAENLTSSFDGYSCSVGDYGAPEMTFAVQVPTNSEVTIGFEGADPTEVNHDLFILDGSDFSCSPASCIAMGFNEVSFDAQAGSNYYLVVDGDTLSAGPFLATINCN